MSAPVCVGMETEKVRESSAASPGVWNVVMLVGCATLVIVDPVGPLGYAARWFFCALIFAAVKSGLERFGVRWPVVLEQKGAMGEAAKWFYCGLIFAVLTAALRACGY